MRTIDEVMTEDIARLQRFAVNELGNRPLNVMAAHAAVDAGQWVHPAYSVANESHSPFNDWRATEGGLFDAKPSHTFVDRWHMEHPHAHFLVVEPELLAILLDGDIQPWTADDETVEAESHRQWVQAEAKDRVQVLRYGPVGEIEPLSISDLMNQPTPRWIVDELFREDTVAVLAGASGLGKSFVMLDVSLSIASGQKFLDHNVKPGKVLYVASEGAASFKLRIDAWQKWRNVQVDNDKIRFVSAGVNLSDKDSVAKLAAFVKDEQFDFIVLDTYSQLSGVTSENDAAENAKAIKAAASIKDAHKGATVVLVHHPRKSDDVMRGSGTLYANVDTVVSAKATDNGFYLSTRETDGGKVKDGAKVRIDGLALQSHANSAVVVKSDVAEQAGAQAEARTAILIALADGEISTAELRERSGSSGGTFDRANAALVKEGRIEQVRRGVYRLSAPVVPLTVDTATLNKILKGS